MCSAAWRVTDGNGGWLQSVSRAGLVVSQTQGSWAACFSGFVDFWTSCMPTQDAPEGVWYAVHAVPDLEGLCGVWNAREGYTCASEWPVCLQSVKVRTWRA